jgi:hypothetical protein
MAQNNKKSIPCATTYHTSIFLEFSHVDLETLAKIWVLENWSSMGTYTFNSPSKKNLKKNLFSQVSKLSCKL